MKLLLLCEKSKPYIRKFEDGIYKALASFYDKEDIVTRDLLNELVVAECDFEVEKIKYRYDTSAYKCNNINDYYYTNTLTFKQLEERSCLTNKDLLNYLGQNDGYAIHIKNLHIFDKPKELSDYYTFNGIVNDVNSWKPIDKAPQNMMYAYELISKLGLSGTCNMQLKKNIVISIRPEWLCKILNGEKTIEVRRKVLKEMLK